VPRISLNPVTIGNPDLPTACAVASAAGYQGIAVRYDRLEAFLAAGHTIEQARRLVADAGLHISEVGFLAEWQFHGGLPLISQRSRQGVDTNLTAELDALHRFFAHCQALGAQHVTAAGTRDRVGSLEEGAADFARLCGMAAPYGLQLGFEFFGDALCCSRIPEAARMVHLAAAPNGGLLWDTYLSYLGGSQPEELSICQELGVPLHAVHFVDAQPGEPSQLDILSGRALPGQGVMPLDRVLAALRAVNYDDWLTIEVFNPPMPPDEAGRVAKLALVSAEAMVRDAWSAPA
jgi:sugar phosphate isomerase/epimerase